MMRLDFGINAHFFSDVLFRACAMLITIADDGHSSAHEIPPPLNAIMAGIILNVASEFRTNLGQYRYRPSLPLAAFARVAL